jgi:hypothetical protein
MLNAQGLCGNLNRDVLFPRCSADRELLLRCSLYRRARMLVDMLELSRESL